MLAADEKTAKRHHEEHAKQPAGERDDGHLSKAGNYPPQVKSGMVKMSPDAREDEAEPMVWLMLASRIVV